MWGQWESARLNAVEQAAWFKANGLTPREALQALGVTVPPGSGWDIVTDALEAELIAIREAQATLRRLAA